MKKLIILVLVGLFVAMVPAFALAQTTNVHVTKNVNVVNITDTAVAKGSATGVAIGNTNSNDSTLVAAVQGIGISASVAYISPFHVSIHN